MTESTASGPIASSAEHLIAVCRARPGDDPIFALDAEARRRVAAGESILNATLGALTEDDGRLAVLPAVAEAFAGVPLEKASAYAPISGPPAFLRGVVRDLYGDGPLAAEAVAAATPGGTGALHAAIVNFLEPGQALLTTSYYWGPYRILAEHSGRRVETFPMFEGAGRLDVGAMEARLVDLARRQGRALLLLNFPCHNPTGYSLDDAEWEGVVGAVRAAAALAPVTLLLDVAYAHFGAPGSAGWVRHVEGLRGEALVAAAWTASKAFAQYGGRIGALVASSADEAQRERLRNALGFTCRGTWSNCNHLGLLAVARLLEERALRERSQAERVRLVDLLGARVRAFNAAAAEAGLAYPRYEGGFFVAVFTPDAARTAAVMRAEGVFVVPLQGAVRVALCSTPEAAVPRLVEALARGVRAAEAGA